MRLADFDDALYLRLVEVEVAGIRFGNRLFRDDFSEGRFGRAIAFCNRTRANDGRFNRVVGFGANELDLLDEIIAFFDQARIPCQLDICPSHASPELLETLHRAGFRPTGSCSVFRGVPGPVQARVDGVRVEEATGPAVLEWLDLHQSLGEKPPLAPSERQARAAFIDEYREYRTFFASIEGERVAVGALLFDGDACHLSNASTRSDRRGLGCQQALLLHRVDFAWRHGATLAVTQTMFGTTSHRNVERVGFRLAYNPTFWVRPLAARD